MPNARHVDAPGAEHPVPLEAPEIANTLIPDYVEK